MQAFMATAPLNALFCTFFRGCPSLAIATCCRKQKRSYFWSDETKTWRRRKRRHSPNSKCLRTTRTSASTAAVWATTSSSRTSTTTRKCWCPRWGSCTPKLPTECFFEPKVGLLAWRGFDWWLDLAFQSSLSIPLKARSKTRSYKTINATIYSTLEIKYSDWLSMVACLEGMIQL